MSHLSEEIERLLSQSGQSAYDVAAKTGLSKGQIYLWKNGEQTSITESQLGALAQALSNEPLDHARLVRAHLLDEKFGPGSDLVSVECLPGEARDERPRPRSKRERALEILREHSLGDRDLADVLVSLAKLYEKLD